MFPLTLLLLAPAADPTPAEVFEKRLLPIFKSDSPSSCTNCHLAGVDLKNYVRPSHRETFLSLRDQGLIDLDAPEKSRILALIDMGKRPGGSSIVPDRVRAAEYEAFAEWIKSSAADPELRAAPKLPAEKLAKPARPDAVIRHARTDRVLESFTDTVWAMRFRCMGCHTEGSAENRKHAAEYGDRVSWFKAAGPAATLDYLRQSKLLDAKNPEKSLLLLKPLNAVKHGGGVKFLVGDEGYQAVRRFLEDYAKTVNDGYAAAADLPPKPAVKSFGTDVWLKFTDTPPTWADKLVAVKLFARDEKTGTWEAEPVATTDRKVWGGGKLWQHTLTLHAAATSDRAAKWAAGPVTLPPGTYLARVYLDADGKLAKDWTATLGQADTVGSVEVESRWPAGYGKMTAVNATRVKKE